MGIQRFEPNARMSEAVVHGNTVYLAGQLGQEGQDITEQTRTALAEVDRALALAGTNKSHLLQVTIWLRDMKDFAAMNAVWDAWIDPQNPPARATGKVELANPKLDIEIVVIAALPQ